MRSLEVTLLHKEPERDVLPVYALVVAFSLQKLQDYGLEEVDLLAAPLAPEPIDPRDDDKQLISQVYLWLVGEETSKDTEVDVDLNSQ